MKKHNESKTHDTNKNLNKNKMNRKIQDDHGQITSC